MFGRSTYLMYPRNLIKEVCTLGRIHPNSNSHVAGTQRRPERYYVELEKRVEYTRGAPADAPLTRRPSLSSEPGMKGSGYIALIAAESVKIL